MGRHLPVTGSDRSPFVVNAKFRSKLAQDDSEQGVAPAAGSE